MENGLTTEEQMSLQAYESVIAASMESFLEVGNALCQIRDGELYRETHGTFEAYVKERWNMGRAHAYRLIFAASMSPIGDKVGWKPTSESQARVLKSVPEEHREAVLTEATAAHGPSPTASQITKAANSVVGADIDRPQNETAFEIKPPREYDLEQDDAKDKEDLEFIAHIAAMDAMVARRKGAELADWGERVHLLGKRISKRRNGL